MSFVVLDCQGGLPSGLLLMEKAGFLNLPMLQQSFLSMLLEPSMVPVVSNIDEVVSSLALPPLYQPPMPSLLLFCLLVGIVGGCHKKFNWLSCHTVFWRMAIAFSRESASSTFSTVASAVQNLRLGSNNFREGVVQLRLPGVLWDFAPASFPP